ncbi:MAG: hypothetical protein QM733_00985 [Ilumatobacteraceae bacterium]
MRDLNGGFASFAARYAHERLAIIDRDVDRLVELLGGDLSASHQYVRVAEAMIEARPTRRRARLGTAGDRSDQRLAGRQAL